jgi:hypothetical protein
MPPISGVERHYHKAGEPTLDKTPLVPDAPDDGYVYWPN